MITIKAKTLRGLIKHPMFSKSNVSSVRRVGGDWFAKVNNVSV